jgi:hypothetical protein
VAAADASANRSTGGRILAGCCGQTML